MKAFSDKNSAKRPRPFSDSDLKRLKEARHFEEHDILALVARLEAAEERIRTTSAWLDKITDDEALRIAQEADKAWRKAAGK